MLHTHLPRLARICVMPTHALLLEESSIPTCEVTADNNDLND
jgi:hypothetical protein